MEDQTNGCIYEIASPVELGAAGYRGQALIVRRYALSCASPSPTGRWGWATSAGAGKPCR